MFQLENIAQAANNLEYAWRRGVFGDQPLQQQFGVLANLILLNQQIEALRNTPNQASEETAPPLGQNPPGL